MENTRILLENGTEATASGIFYIFNSKYYFIYTLGEAVDNDYVQVYVVQVCKEVKNTQSGPVETGYMIGIETSNPEEWSLVQKSITKIVDDKKNLTSSNEIQYLGTNMLNNLRIVSKNKLKLMNRLMRDVFNLNFSAGDNSLNSVESFVSETDSESNIPVSPESSLSHNYSQSQNGEDIIIDYRAKFFEEQDKNKELEEEINNLQQKLDSVRSIIE